MLPIAAWGGMPGLGEGFYVALICGGVVDAAGTVCYMRAVRQGELSLVLPLLAFTPLFVLLFGPLINGEWPTGQGAVGVGLVFAGTYALRLDHRRAGWLGPLRSLFQEHSAHYMLAAALLWSLTVSLHKVGIEASSVWFWPGAYFGSMALGMLPLLWWRGKGVSAVWPQAVPMGLCGALIAFFQALGLSMGLVVYVASIKNTSALMAVGIGAVVFKEAGSGARAVGAVLMAAGAALIAAA